MVEHPLRQGWKLVDSPAPVETTEKLYRFQQPVGAGKTEKLTLTEESVSQQQIQLVSANQESLVYYNRMGEISIPVRNALGKAISLRQAVAESERQLQERHAQIATITADQTRIRENIKTVEKTSDYATRQLKKLDDQENQIDKVRAEIDALQIKVEAQRGELSTYLDGLNVG